jgi:hypothetical protein
MNTMESMPELGDVKKQKTKASQFRRSRKYHANVAPYAGTAKAMKHAPNSGKATNVVIMARTTHIRSPPSSFAASAKKEAKR